MQPFDLNEIHVTSPCTVSWETMTGDERARFCKLCKLNVYNLSGMTKAEATELLQAKEGRVCVRYFKRADGTVITRDCGTVRSARGRRKIAFAVASGAMLLINMMIWIEFRRRTVSSQYALIAPPTKPVDQAKQSRLYTESMLVQKSVDWIEHTLEDAEVDAQVNSEPFVTLDMGQYIVDSSNF